MLKGYITFDYAGGFSKAITKIKQYLSDTIIVENRSR